MRPQRWPPQRVFWQFVLLCWTNSCSIISLDCLASSTNSTCVISLSEPCPAPPWDCPWPPWVVWPFAPGALCVQVRRVWFSCPSSPVCPGRWGRWGRRRLCAWCCSAHGAQLGHIYIEWINSVIDNLFGNNFVSGGTFAFDNSISLWC